MRDDMGLRLAALGVAVVCLGLAFSLATGMPGVLLMMALASVSAALLVRQGWLGVWLLMLGGLWTAGFGLLALNGSTDLVSAGFMGLALTGLSALFVAIIPPQVAARRRAAWPFGYLNPRKAAGKAKRERLLYEEEVIYDVPGRGGGGWDEDDAADEAPLPRKRKAAQ